MRSRAWTARWGFTLIDAAVSVVAVALLGVLLVAMTHEPRRVAGVETSLANLRQIGAHTGAYGADNDDRFWTFTWRVGTPAPASYPDLQGGTTDAETAAAEATMIIRKRGQLPLFQYDRSWFPHRSSHLVLHEYLGDRLPSTLFVSPEDRALLLWQRNPGNPCAVAGAPCPAAFSVQQRQRLAFESSYGIPAAFFSPDASGAGVSTVAPSTDHRFYLFSPSVQVGGRRLSQIAFPSHKVMLFDREQRHFGRRLYFGETAARVALLMSDGAAGVRRTGDANPGFQPNNPLSVNPSLYRYQPDPAFEPPTSTGQVFIVVQGRYDWTRSGLRGRDFGGPAVPWVP